MRPETGFWAWAAGSSQAYWLYTTYQLTNAQFARTVREALLAVQQQQQNRLTRQLLAAARPGPAPMQLIIRQLRPASRADSNALEVTARQ